MSKSTTDLAREGVAPSITRCVVLGEGDNVRLAFLTGSEGGAPSLVLSAVTLTRSQLTGFAGMVAAILDSADSNATSVN